MELGLITILMVLAIYRVSRMLALEKGPFGAFEWMRGAVVQIAGATSWLSEGFGCPLCWSVWVALADVIALYLSVLLDLSVPFYAVHLWLGLSGAASLLYKLEH